MRRHLSAAGVVVKCYEQRSRKYMPVAAMASEFPMTFR
jgi:hypothetical protein